MPSIPVISSYDNKEMEPIDKIMNHGFIPKRGENPVAFIIRNKQKIPMYKANQLKKGTNTDAG